MNTTGLAKLLFIIVSTAFFSVLSVLLTRRILEQSLRLKRAILVVPVKKTLWQDFGVVMEPEIELELKTKEGFVPYNFLLDSGAVVSSLPPELAAKTGQDLAFLPRSPFRGFGNTTSFAYRGKMLVKIGENEEELPVVFTEAGATRAILGRKGFFESFSVFFDAKGGKIEIRK